MGYLIEHTCFRFVEIRLQIKSQMKKLRWLLLAQFFQCFILLQSRILHSSFTSKFEDYNNAENLRKVNFLFSKERNQLIKNEHFGVTAITNQFTYDYVKLKIGYFSNRIPVWEGIFTLENLT